MREVFGVFNIPRMNFCDADFTYLDLVDTVNNAGNKIIFNTSCGADQGNCGKKFSCPGSIFQSVVKILRSVRFESRKILHASACVLSLNDFCKIFDPLPLSALRAT